MHPARHCVALDASLATISCTVTLRTRSTGIAKPIPSDPPLTLTDLANGKLGRIHGEHRVEADALIQERDGLFTKLAGLRTECDAAQRERDENLSLVTRLKEHHRLDLD